MKYALFLIVSLLLSSVTYADVEVRIYKFGVEMPLLTHEHHGPIAVRYDTSPTRPLNLIFVDGTDIEAALRSGFCVNQVHWIKAVVDRFDIYGSPMPTENVLVKCKE